ARRQRLARKDIQRCAGECAFVERGDDIGLDLQRAARGVDEVGAARSPVALELAQKLQIEDAVRRRRRRQQADENFAATKKRLESSLAVEAFDAGKFLLRAAPSGDAKAEPRERYGRGGTERAPA